MKQSVIIGLLLGVIKAEHLHAITDKLSDQDLLEEAQYQLKKGQSMVQVNSKNAQRHFDSMMDSLKMLGESVSTQTK